MRVIKSILLLELFLVTLLSAQLTTNFNINTTYDDNLFRSPEADSDLLTDLNLNLSYSPGKSNVVYFFNPTYFSYNSNYDRNFIVSELGFRNLIRFGGDQKQAFYFGAEWDMRINGDDYYYYDYNQIYAYANINFNLDYFFLKTGYNYRYRSYSEIPDLTNNRHYVFVQANKSFQTRTSIILETDLGYKSFAGQELYSTTFGGGRGSGRMSSSSTTSYSETEIPSLSQAVFLVRIAQSLHEKIGIYIQYRKQISLNDETTYVNSDNYYQDEELFDDPFSYESDAYSSRLTWMMPWHMKLQLGAGVISKNYISELAFESAEDTVGVAGIRADDQKNLSLNISKKFFPKKVWLNSLTFNFSYAYILNESNSYWYDYKNNYYSAGIRWNF